MKGEQRRVVIMGAAGRDFHNFIHVFRDDPSIEVIAFTAAQIPGIAGRRFPHELAGERYPDGIPIIDEQFLERLIDTHRIDQVVFSYSDIAHVDVMHHASRVIACGADFVLLGTQQTMLKSSLPLIAVSAVRTGCGKSQVARWLVAQLRDWGFKPAVMRHPMPYGELRTQRLQRFATLADLRAANCTIEEREEYEPHLACGAVVYAGIDYRALLAQVENDCDLIVWDGGNNDYPFIRPDLHIVLTDPLRAGDEIGFHPGEAVLRMADIVLVTKADCATAEQIDSVYSNVEKTNSAALLLRGSSPVTLEQADRVAGSRVLVVEDGPTITHGGMAHGAGYRAALAAGAAHIVDPRPYAPPSIREAYDRYPHIGRVLPALGYYPEQIAALRATIDASDAELVICGTPIDLEKLLQVNKPVLRARYEYAEMEKPGLAGAVHNFLSERGVLDRSAAVASVH